MLLLTIRQTDRNYGKLNVSAERLALHWPIQMESLFRLTNMQSFVPLKPANSLPFYGKVMNTFLIFRVPRLMTNTCFLQQAMERWFVMMQSPVVNTGKKIWEKMFTPLP